MVLSKTAPCLLLLIFFMVVGHLAVSDPFKVNPVQSDSKGMASSQDILLLVGIDGRLALDGVVMDEATFKITIAEKISKATDRQQETPLIHLKADGQAQATRIVAIMELLRDVGIEKLKLLTVENLN